MDGDEIVISLRRATALTMAAVFTALASVGGVLSYLSASHESNEFLDLQQRQIARYVGDLTFVAPGEAALPPHDPDRRRDQDRRLHPLRHLQPLVAVCVHARHVADRPRGGRRLADRYVAGLRASTHAICHGETILRSARRHPL